MADVAVFLQRGRAMSWRHLHRIEIQGEIERALSDAAAALAAHAGAGAHGAYYTPGKSGCGGAGSDAATPRRRPRPSSDLFRVFAAPAPAPTPAPAPASEAPASGTHTAGGGPRRPPPLQWVPDALGRRGDGGGDGAAEAAARSRARAGGRGGERGGAAGGAAGDATGGAAGGAAGGAIGGAAAAGKARSRALFPLQIPQAAGLCDNGGGAPHGLLRQVTPVPPATGREAAQWQTGQAPREVVGLSPTAVTGRLRAAFSGWRE